MSNMVEEILRPGDTHISLLLKTVVESSMFFKAVSIRSISLTLKSNGDSPRILQILKKKTAHALLDCLFFHLHTFTVHKFIDFKLH